MMKKSTQTNIDNLNNQKRLNVQEQILVKKDKIQSEAKYWRIHGIPKPLEQVLRQKGIDIEKSIFLNYEQGYPGISTDVGIVLTYDGIFFEFDTDLNTDRTELIELYSFTDVSDRFEIDGNKKGIGKTYGFLAIEVLKELDNNENESHECREID
jgi:hypothetical protein